MYTAKKSRFWSVGVAALALVSSAYAQTTYFVATNGSDSGATTGTNWAHAFLTISNAVAHTVDSDTIIVSNGTYVISAPITITNDITLISTNGQSVTIIDAQKQADVRCMYLDHSGLVVEGFTIRGGYRTSGGGGGGGGILMLEGKVQWCTIDDCRGYGEGGSIWAQGGLVQYCVVKNGDYGHYGGTVRLDNSAIIRNCLIYDNVYRRGAGIWLDDVGCRAENCTVVANTATDFTGGIQGAGGISVNCLVYFNTDPDDSGENHNDSGFTYTCSTPQPTGTGNVGGDPLLVDLAGRNLHVLPGSPCTNSGTTNLAWLVAEPNAVDLDGNPRVVNGSIDMGCYQYIPGALDCTFTGDALAGMEPLQTVFTAFIAGTNTTGMTYYWDFDNDGTNDANGVVATNDYSVGNYGVSLTVSNAIGESDSYTRLSYIQAGASVVYVSTNGSDTTPYDTWAKAASSIQDAVDLGVDGTTVFVSNGTYAINSTISITRGIELIATNGSSVTTIDAQLQSDVRCVYMSHSNAVIEGFTITRGHRTAGGGGGVYLDDGTVRWCVITACDAEGDGNAIKAVNGGLIDHCIMRDNQQGNYHGTVYLASDAVIRNSLIRDNRYRRGCGIWMLATSSARVENCTVVGNIASEHTGGIYRGAGSIVNTIVYFNSDPDDSGENYNTDAGFTYACSTPLLTGAGNIEGDPLFVDRFNGDAHLLPGTLCTNAGNTNLSWLVSNPNAVDLDGNPRVVGGKIDMGCYQYAVGALDCCFVGDSLSGLEPHDTVFTAYGAGTNMTGVTYYWDFDDDGTNDATGAVVTNSFSAGTYTVSVTISNAAGETDTYTRPSYVQAAPSVIYVSKIGSDTSPYDTWAKASGSIQDAINVAVDGAMVVVSNGTYTETNTVNITKGIVLRSLNGRAATIVRTSQPSVRAMYISHADAIVDGFSVQRQTSWGGGVRINLYGAIKNCDVLNSKWAHGYGAGIKMNAGSASNCLVSGSEDRHQGGVALDGGGALMTHCTIISNINTVYTTSDKVGGVRMASGTTLRNCLIYGNSGIAHYGGISSSGGTIESCTIVSNTCNNVAAAAAGGIGQYGGTIRNSIIWGNYNTQGGPRTNWYRSSGTIEYSCTTPSAAAYGSGNIAADPQFEDAANHDYRLTGVTPCHNVGLDQAWMTAAEDLYGNPRIRGGTVDMGVYEGVGSGFVLVVR